MDRNFIIEAGTLLSIEGGEEHVSIPEGVHTIAGHVFAHPEKIRAITLPETVTELEEHAFEGCSIAGAGRLCGSR